MGELRIGLIQMMCEKAAIARNLKRMAGIIDEAATRGVDVVGFPEMCITGYADPTRQPEAIICLDGPAVARVMEMTRRLSLTVLAGLIEDNPAGKPFITQIVVRDGKLVGCYRKRRIEDEELEWFSPGDGVPIFAHGDVTFGIAICADIGSREVFEESACQGARIVFELAAPGLYGEQATRNWRSGFEWWEGECQKHLSQYAREYGIWVAVATQAGRTVDEDFPGGGYVFAPGGQRVYATRDWSPGEVYLELDLEARSVQVLE
jgi:predicted amidohydrolase